MTIVASGEVSLGGNATATRSVACELGRSGTAAICMNESAVRTLAARTTAASAICMNDFYGKSNVPTAFGAFYNGGYYTGITSTLGCSYYLLVAPNATGCDCCAWKNSDTNTNNFSNAICNCNNGYWNTFTYLNNANHPAGNWTATRSIGGFSDWYLPARNELNVLYTNKGSMPAGEGYASDLYWSSSENPSNYCLAIVENLNTGYITNNYKSTPSRLRAVRRNCFTPSTPITIGQFIFGGYYVGTITSPANYYLIVAPNASGCACCQWKTINSLTNNCSNATCNCNNGYWNTFTYLNSADHPAGNWTATRSIGGFSDWYLPARNELNVLYTNKGSMPAGEGYGTGSHWSSTEGTLTTIASCNVFLSGNIGYANKNTTEVLRAVRRVSF